MPLNPKSEAPEVAAPEASELITQQHTEKGSNNMIPQSPDTDQARNAYPVDSTGVTMGAGIPAADLNALIDKTTATFEAIVASFDKAVQCLELNKSGTECRRPVTWSVDVHGCDSGILCGYHYRAWERENLSRLAAHGRLTCLRCPRKFAYPCWTAHRI